jgi:hypothetical protein
MDRDALIALGTRHTRAELDNDIDATMATVGPNPVWRFFSSRTVIEGYGAVRDYYTQLLPRTGIEERTIEILDVYTTPTSAAVHSRARSRGRERYVIETVALLSIEDGLITSEQVFGLPNLPDSIRGPLPLA